MTVQLHSGKAHCSPPTMFCICSFIPQFSTRKANAGALAGRKRLALVNVWFSLLRRSPHGSRPALLYWGRFSPPPQGTSGNVWGQFWLARLGEGSVSSIRW